MSKGGKRNTPSARRRKFERATPREQKEMLKEEAERQEADARRKARLKVEPK